MQEVALLNGIKDGNRNINDGFFNISFQQDGVYLTVYPPVGKARPVEVNDVIDRLNRKKVKNYNKDLVEACVRAATKTPFKIAEPQEEVSINATATVHISPDKMKASISFTPPENGRMLTYDEIMAVLREHGVIYGINKTNIEAVVRFPIYGEMITVAEGTPPVNGQNGKVEFHFDLQKQTKPTILEDGRVDFRELNLIESVVEGQKLCTLIPPTPGIPGKTVLGTDVPALDGKPAVLPKGRNVKPSEDGMSLVAAISGQVTYQDGKVHVFSTYEVPADVDNSTGNINFVGNVLVRGNVLSGFTIDAGGNVEVWGVVEGATIKAGGDIILRRGMSGMGKGVLISGGDIIARFIENSTVQAANNIKSEAIMHSHIKCGNKLELSGRKGLLVGGSAKVGREIVAKVIGSYLATVTDIEVGVDPTLRERYKELKDEIARMEVDLRKAEQAITLLKKLELQGGLTPEKQEIMAKSVRTRLFYTNRLSEYKAEVAEIESKLQQEAYGKVRAYNVIYPGTKVAIGSCLMYVRENLQYCTLYRDGADIRVGPIDK